VSFLHLLKLFKEQMRGHPYKLLHIISYSIELIDVRRPKHFFVVAATRCTILKLDHWLRSLVILKALLH
jgi:hypothetical protein